MSQPKDHSGVVARRLSSYFGRRWRVWLIVVVLAIFWPLALFWNRLSFDPARFAEEWVKVGVTGVLLFIILEIVKFEGEVRSQLFTSIELITSIYVLPAENALDLLSGYHECVLERDIDQAAKLAAKVREVWPALLESLSESRMRHANDYRVFEVVDRARLALLPERSSNSLKEILSRRVMQDEDKAELVGIIRRLENFVSILKSGIESFSL